MNYHPRRWLSMLVLTAMLTISAFASQASACPNCRETLPNGDKNAAGQAQPNVAQGYAWSIYLMIAVPFAMVATLGGAAFIVMRKADAGMKPPLAK